MPGIWRRGGRQRPKSRQKAEAGQGELIEMMSIEAAPRAG